MNAGGVFKACKSSAIRLHGKRESNTLVIYPEDRDNLAKAGIIPDSLCESCSYSKAPALLEEPMFHQLVGEVRAHQGDDGYRV